MTSFDFNMFHKKKMKKQEILRCFSCNSFCDFLKYKRVCISASNHHSIQFCKTLNKQIKQKNQIKMKFVIVFVALFAVALAADVEIVRSESEVGPESYKYE